MKDDFRSLWSSSFCFIDEDEEDDDNEDEERHSELRDGVEGDDRLSFEGEEILNLEGLDGLGMRIEFWWNVPLIVSES